MELDGGKKGVGFFVVDVFCVCVVGFFFVTDDDFIKKKKRKEKGGLLNVGISARSL